MRGEFLTERASEHFGMLRATTHRSHNTSVCVYNTTSSTEREILYMELTVTCRAGSQFIDVIYTPA